LFRRLATVTVATATALALAAVPAGADDTDVFTTMPEATAQTAQANLVHFQDVATQNNDNISCRVEAPVFVAQPEIDGRVTVKGEDTAVSAAECVDLMLVADYQLTLLMTLEYFDTDLRIWRPILDANGRAIAKRCSTPSVKGVAALVCPLDAVLTANNAASGKLHRVGAALESPKQFAPLYTESALRGGVKALTSAEVGGV
jgi:hypothetical protein